MDPRTRRLRLSRETLRELHPPELRRAAGATGIECDLTTVTTVTTTVATLTDTIKLTTDVYSAAASDLNGNCGSGCFCTVACTVQTG